MNEPYKPYLLILRSTSLYALGGFLARLVSVLSIPFFLRFISVEEFGMQSMAMLADQMMTVMTGYVLINGATKIYAESLGDPVSEGAVVGTVLAGLSVVLALGFAAWVQAAKPLAALLFQPGTGGEFLTLLAGAASVFGMLCALAQSLWQVSDRAMLYNLSALVRTAVAVSSGLFFVSHFSLGVAGVLLGWIVGAGLSAVVSILILVHRLPLRISAQVLQQVLAYGLPLLPAAVMNVVLAGSDRYLLKLWLGLQAVGIFAAAQTIVNGLRLILLTPFKQAWSAAMWRYRDTPHETTIHGNVLKGFLLLQLPILALLMAFPDLPVRLLFSQRPEFVAATSLVAILYGGALLYGTYDVLSSGYFLAGHTQYYSAGICLSAVSSLILNVLLIPRWGLYGSSVSFLVANLVFALTAHLFARQYLFVPHAWGTLIGRVMAFLFVGAIGMVLRKVFPGIPGAAAASVWMALSLSWLVRRYGRGLRSALTSEVKVERQ